jgi:hypothetical protein
MTETEYRNQMAQLDARFDGEIKRAAQQLESALAAAQKERAKYEKWWRDENAKGSFNPANPWYNWTAAQRQIEAARRGWEIAQAEAARAADVLAAFKANKASRQRKLTDAYAASYMAQAEARARAELAQMAIV